MTNVSELVATVLYQDVQIAQDLTFSELSMENAVLDLSEPLPVASELSVRIAHPDGQVLGHAVVTRVRESRATGESGCMHVRWVEFTDADFAMLAGWVSATDAQPPKKRAPKQPKAAPAPEPAPEPVVAEEAAPEPAPEPVVAEEAAPEAAPEPVVAEEAAPEAAPEPVVAEEAAPEAAPEPVDSVPEPVSEEGERTIPIDPGATMLDLAAVSDAMPVEDTAAHEGSSDGSGEEGSSAEDDGSSSGDEEGGDKKKRRRRTKKK
ncbi:hypothetical protein KKD52_00225 [Myxococcota bacterium]|nr:hypothetical protein [Myxococcota bacterium]MBU1508756.1 hypothetical protein [Myxococcota bacterium]